MNVAYIMTVIFDSGISELGDLGYCSRFQSYTHSPALQILQPKKKHDRVGKISEMESEKTWPGVLIFSILLAVTLGKLCPFTLLLLM